MSNRQNPIPINHYLLSNKIGKNKIYESLKLMSVKWCQIHLGKKGGWKFTINLVRTLNLPCKNFSHDDPNLRKLVNHDDMKMS